MIQQINLYQAEFQITRDWLSQLLMAGIALLILLLAGNSFYQSLIISGFEDELKNKKGELKSLQQSFDVLEKTVQPRAMDMNLAERVERIKRSNEEKIRAKNYLSGDGVGNVTGFSPLLRGLGRQRDEVAELWLKKIQFSDGGFDMRLIGSNHRPELLTVFIQALKDEVLYRDREFREIKINRSKQDKKIMDFVLATRNKGDVADARTNISEKALFMARLKRFREEKVSR